MFTCTAGDILEFPSGRGGAADADARLQAEYFVKGLGLMNYDAVGLGEKDLAFGVAYLRKAADQHHLKFVCTNALDDRSRELLFDPYLIAEKQGVRVGFLAVVSPERHVIAPVESDLLDKKIRLEDPSEAIRKFLPELRKKTDLVVLLAHTGIETAKFLAQDVPVDVVIVGHYPAILEQPERLGDVVFTMAGSHSDRFGTLDLTLGPEGKIKDVAGDAVRLLMQGPQDGAIHELFLEQDRKQKEARREQQIAEQRARDSEARKEKIEIAYHRGGILGAETCRTCHTPQYDGWMQTPHATAFATLAEADAWDDPECIGCHVTGVTDKRHVDDVNITPEVWNVQCEECHGSAFQHARDGSYVGLGEATCRKCHDADNSPEFEYELYSSYGVH